MGLESKIPGWSHLDKYVHKEYSLVTKWWEDKGHSRYTLSAMLGISNIVALNMLGPVLDHMDYSGSTFSNMQNGYMDYAITGLAYTIATTMAIDPIHSMYKQLAPRLVGGPLSGKDLFDNLFESTRLPFIAFSSLYAATGVQFLIEENSWYSFTLCISSAASFFASGSSMYIKSGDPKPPKKKESFVRKFLTRMQYTPAKDMQHLPGM